MKVLELLKQLWKTAKSALLWGVISTVAIAVLGLMVSNSAIPGLVGLVVNNILIDGILGTKIKVIRKYFEEYASEKGEFFNADFFDILYVDCMQTRLKTLWAFEIAFFALISPISTFLNNHQIPNSKIVIAIIMVAIAEFAWVLFLSCISSYQKYVSDLIQARRHQKAAALRKDIKDLKDEDLVWGEYKNDELEIIDNMKKKYCMLMPNPSLPQHAEPPEN